MKNIRSILALIFFLPLLSFSLQLEKDPVIQKKYAGTYQFGTDGVPLTAQSDKYVLNADASATWTAYNKRMPDGTVAKGPIVDKGEWRASEGLIILYFYYGEDASPEPTYKFDGTVFPNGDTYLKKFVAKVTPKPAPKPVTKPVTK